MYAHRHIGQTKIKCSISNTSQGTKLLKTEDNSTIIVIVMISELSDHLHPFYYPIGQWMIQFKVHRFARSTLYAGQISSDNYYHRHQHRHRLSRGKFKIIIFFFKIAAKQHAHMHLSGWAIQNQSKTLSSINNVSPMSSSSSSSTPMATDVCASKKFASCIAHT